MATYTSDIVYSVKGMDASTGQVIKLTDAITKLEKRGVPLSQSAQKAAAGIRAMDVATQSALQRLSGSNQSIDPLRMGLASLATQYIQTGRAVTQSEAAIASLSTTQKAAVAANNALLLGMGAGALVAAGYAGSLVRTGDAYTALRGKINVYAKDAANAAVIEERLFKVAAEARTSIEGVISLYSRLAPAFEDLGRSQAEAARFTELVSKALTAQGATSREAEASTLQLAQALASGVLRGDEFKSMMEASPGLMRQIAAGFETVGGKVGVPVGALRAMAEEGELTADRVVAAIMRQSQAIETQFAKAPKTVSQAMTVLGNEMTRAIGQQMMESGTQAGLANALMKVADAADEVVKAITQATQAALLLGAGLAGAKLISMVGHFVALQRATYAAAMAVEAFGLAQRSALSANAISATQALATNLPRAAQAATASTAAFSGLNLITANTASNFSKLAPAIDTAAARAANATRTNIVLDGSFGMQARTVENATRVFGSFNSAAGATATNLPVVANAAGALTTRVNTLTVAKNGAAVALNGFRTAGAALITMLGGPWSVGIMAAIALIYSYERATNEATQAQIGQQTTMAQFGPVVAQYESAMGRAATASGKLKKEALETADALRQQAMAMYRSAEAELARRKVSLASSEAMLVEGPGSGAGPEAMAGAAILARMRQASVARAQAAVKEAEAQLAAFGLVVEKMPRGQTSVVSGSATASASPSAKADGTGADQAIKRAQSAADKARQIRERDLALLQQYQAAAEQAAAQSRASEESDLKTTLDRLAIEEREKKRKAAAEITNAQIETEALSQISAEFEAKRVAARKAYADKMATIDQQLAETRLRILEQEAKLSETRATNDLERAQDTARTAATDGNVAAVRAAVDAWNQAYDQRKKIRDSMLDLDIKALEATAAKEIEELRRKLGDTQEFADRRFQIEADLQRRIAILRGQAAEQEKRENEARIKDQTEANERAEKEKLDKMREKYGDYYTAGDRAADAFKTALLTNKWDDLGRSIAIEFMNAVYEEMIGNPLRDWIRGALDSMFSRKGGSSVSLGKPGQTPPILSTIASFFGFAEGGVMTGRGPIPLRKYAQGGIASSPQLAMFGEGSKPEAYVPLNDGRSIPVTLEGPYTDIAPGSRGGGRPVSIVVAPVYNIDATGADPAGLARVEQRLEQMDRDLPANVINLVSEAVYNRQVA